MWSLELLLEEAGEVRRQKAAMVFEKGSGFAEKRRRGGVVGYGA